MVPLEGLEPPLLSEADFESAASTIPPQGQFRGRSLARVLQKWKPLLVKNLAPVNLSWHLFLSASRSDCPECAFAEALAPPT